MERTHATYEELSRLLPQLEELESLRMSIVGAAEPDPTREWDRSSAFSTIDKRVIAWGDLEGILGEAEVAAHAHVSSIFARLGPLVAAVREGRAADAAGQLVAMGEHYEGIGRFDRARLCFDAALTVSLPLPDKAPQILALRRIARATFAQGDPVEAVAYYERSALLAGDARDAAGEVIARTGIGNVLSVQGWFAEAEQSYRTALARLEGSGLDLALERAHLYNNLGLVATQQGKLDEAGRWLTEAETLWSGMDAPNDLAICYHNVARLREREGDVEAGHRRRVEALRIATLPHVLAGIAIDLAEACLPVDRLEEAARWGRAAEQHAIAARSPYLLGRIYQVLGNIARAHGAADGFVFYEKALEIARERSLPFLEAETLVDYAILRGRGGEAEEARAFLQRSIELLDRLGGVHERNRAEQALAALPDAWVTDRPATA